MNFEAKNVNLNCHKAFAPNSLDLNILFLRQGKFAPLMHQP